jgi:quercetin dioxygenase-like cupin family protein
MPDADEIFIPAGVPHSTKNVASGDGYSKWFYVSLLVK